MKRNMDQLAYVVMMFDSADQRNQVIAPFMVSIWDTWEGQLMIVQWYQEAYFLALETS